MPYKLAVAPKVEFPIKFELEDAGKVRKFSARLVGDRVEEDVIQAHIEAQQGQSTREIEVATSAFLQQRITGWRDQTLVLDEDTDAPAAFSADAFGAMLAVAGMTGLVFAAYAEANRAKGKRGN